MKLEKDLRFLEWLKIWRSRFHSSLRRYSSSLRQAMPLRLPRIFRPSSRGLWQNILGDIVDIDDAGTPPKFYFLAY
jgi:hypothetical protein